MAKGEKKNGGLAVRPVDKKRLAVYEQMNKDLRQVCDTMGERLARAAAGNVILNYDVGSMIGAVVAREPQFGSGAVELLAAYHGRPATVLYALRDFAASFDREFVADWSGREMKEGGFMTERHWMCLRQVAKREKQEKLLHRVINDSLSAADLERIIRGEGIEKKNIRTGYRKPSQPTSPLAGLQKFAGLTNTLINYEEQIAETSIFTAIDEMAPDDVNESLLSRLVDTATKVRKASERLSSADDRLTANIERIEGILSGRPAAEDEDQAAPAAAAKPTARKATRKAAQAGPNGAADGKAKEGKKKSTAARSKRPAVAS